MTTDAFSGKSEGKEHLRNAIGGLIFLLGGYLIFLQINPDILKIDFSTASGRVEVLAGQIPVGLDGDDSDDYSIIRNKNILNGYDGEECVGLTGLVTSFTESEIKEKCEENRNNNEFKNKKTTVCAKKNWTGGAIPSFLDLTVTYCFSYKSGHIEEQNEYIKSLGENVKCSPCRSETGSCDTAENTLRGNIVSQKYLMGAGVHYCAYDGDAGYKRDYQCLKGEKIDESKYVKQGSDFCKKKDCEDFFNYLKNKNHWPSSCTYKMVYKKYIKKDKFKSEFWIYTDKNTCK